ncbi:iron ABC transporter permease [Streptomyces sp. NPDC006656]|uniref:FecCD family ABC transporter permease n=1 Tax=Streptomyces sp. NPDC006656 TaxID=3156899 RepID=UPI003456F553
MTIPPHAVDEASPPAALRTPAPEREASAASRPRAGLRPARAVLPAPDSSSRTPRAHRVVRPRVLMACLLVLLPTAALVSVSFGAVSLPLGDVWRDVVGHLSGAGRPSEVSGIDDAIIWGSRVPRTLLAMVAGAGLAVAGAVLQTVVRNPLADPYVLGVTSGASLAAVAVLTLGPAGLLGPMHLGVSAAAFAGACATLALVIALGRRQGSLAPARLVLAGVALSYLLQGATSYLQLRARPDQLSGVLFWLLGSVSGAQWQDLGLPAALVVSCTAWLLLHGRSLNALAMGEETAVLLGVKVNALRLQLLAVSAVLTAAVIAVAGGISFVGLVVPHSVRLLIGADHRSLLPATALAGALFLVVADVAARTVAAPMELPLGILTAVAGTPFFLWLLRRDRAGKEPS